MKFASYSLNGVPGFGAVVGRSIIPLGSVDGGRFASLREAIAAGGLWQLADQVQNDVAGIDVDDVAFLPVIPDPEKIICVGFNYKSHAEEALIEVPPFPSLFVRVTSSLTANNGPILAPQVSTKLDFEGELAIVIGKSGRNIAKAAALDHVAGYTCFNDGSIRDFQKQSVTAGKNFPSTGSLGPWLVTLDEFADPNRLEIVTRLNGEVMQKSTTDLMVYSVADIISYVSSFTKLEPGDVIATGTPSGVGHRRDPQLWMKPGDVVEVEIEGIGVLRNPVVGDHVA